MKKLLLVLGVILIFRISDVLADASQSRILPFVQKEALEGYKAQNPNADSCPTSIIGAHGVVEWDGYGYLADFAGTNHILYYSYNSPATSLVDSTLPGCQQFADVMNLDQTQFDRAFLSPGIQWADNNNCPTIIGCGPLDDDGLVTAADRMVLAVFSVTGTVPYKTKMLVDTVLYDETYSRFAFDASIGDGGGGSGIRHELFTLKAPVVTSVVCSGETCNVVVLITEPKYDGTGASGGLYGDDYQIASHLIAGYKVVAMKSPTFPPNATVNDSNWNMEIEDPDRYISASNPQVGGVRISHPISLNVTELEDVYFAYVPIFNKDSSCQASECTVAELQALDQLGGPIYNSLASRIASAPAHFQSPKPIFESFTGQWTPPSVTLKWKTVSEFNLRGFNIYRSTPQGQRWKRLNTQLIPILGRQGSSYTYEDVFLKLSRSAYLYKVEAINTKDEVVGFLTTQVIPR